LLTRRSALPILIAVLLRLIRSGHRHVEVFSMGALLRISRERVLDCGGKRSATPLSQARKPFSKSTTTRPPKAVSPLALCHRTPRRCATAASRSMFAVSFALKKGASLLPRRSALPILSRYCSGLYGPSTGTLRYSAWACSFGFRASVSWTAAGSAAPRRFRRHENRSQNQKTPVLRKRCRRSRSATALQDAARLLRTAACSQFPLR